MSRLTKEREQEIRDGLGCLVPRPGVAMPSCHERSVCDCLVIDVFSEIDALRARVKELDNSQLLYKSSCESLTKEIAKLRKVVKAVNQDYVAGTDENGVKFFSITEWSMKQVREALRDLDSNCDENARGRG
jgi:hypothetical protein